MGMRLMDVALWKPRVVCDWWKCDDVSFELGRLSVHMLDS